MVRPRCHSLPPCSTLFHPATWSLLLKPLQELPQHLYHHCLQRQHQVFRAARVRGQRNSGENLKGEMAERLAPEKRHSFVHEGMILRKFAFVLTLFPEFSVLMIRDGELILIP